MWYTFNYVIQSKYQSFLTKISKKILLLTASSDGVEIRSHLVRALATTDHASHQNRFLLARAMSTRSCDVGLTQRNVIVAKYNFSK